MTDTTSPHPLVQAHLGVLEQGRDLLTARGFLSRYPEVPSARHYGETAAADGRAAYEARLNARFTGLDDQPGDGTDVGDEVSPYGPVLGVRYPHLDLDAAVAAAQAALPAWRDAGPTLRAAVLVEVIERLHRRSFELAEAVMHTTGQSWVMAFQAGGPHSQDRALEATVAAWVEQLRVASTTLWEKPQKDAPIRMRKDYRIVPRGIALMVGCNTFPTWNGYPGLFASLATGNPVLVKPHPRAILPLAITVQVIREVLAEQGFDPAIVQLAPEGDGEGLAKTIAQRPEVAIVDYTGGPAFGHWLMAHCGATGKRLYAEQAGVNSIVVDSTDNLRGMLFNLAFSLSLYTGQMCTAPQNIYVPPTVATDQGELSFDDVAQRLAGAIAKLTGDDAKAVDVIGATVNPQVRAHADAHAELAASAPSGHGQVVLASRRVTHPAYPDAVCRTPGLVALDAADQQVYTKEWFGPVAFLVRTESTEQSLQMFTSTIREHGAITGAVYSTDETVLDAARDAAAAAAVNLSENLTQGIFVNQAAAFSDYHATGGNPAANASYADAAFVTGRFVVVAARRHV